MNLFAELGPDLPGIEKLRAMKDGNRLTGMEQTLGMRIVVVEGTPGLHLYNPIGRCTAAMPQRCSTTPAAMPCSRRWVSGQVFTTLELKVAFHKPITKDTGPLRAEAKVMSIGRRAAFTEARLTDRTGKLYASATSSLMVISS